VSRRWLIGITVVIVATIALAAWLVTAQGNFIRENIIVPLSYGFWIISMLVKGTPQALFWFILLVLAIILAGRSITGKKSGSLQGRRTDNSYAHRPRLRHWVRQILLSRSVRYKQYLKENLGRLAMDVLGYQQGLTMSQYQHDVDTRLLDPPAILTPFMVRRIELDPSAEGLTWNKIKQWVERTLTSLPFLPHPPPPPDPEMEALVSFLEQQMDMEQE
jgi:uncharacterized membrane protein